MALELAAERSVAVPGVVRVLDEVAGREAGVELRVAEKVVGHTILLAGARRARCRRDRQAELRMALAQRRDQRPLTNPRGSGDHEDAHLPAPRHEGYP